ncbi:phage antirepressor KilAC domain-containing protein [Brachybacterium paraconglomeratum]
MIDLIPIQQNDDGTIAVSARDLHAGLQVATRYSDWVPRMLEYGFTEGEDYVRLAVTAGQPGYSNLRNASVEYALTLDTAKEIAMLQRSERGQQVRRYFIDAEKRLRAAQGVEMSDDELMARAVLSANRTIKALEATVAEQQPKVEAWDHIVSSAGSWSYEEAAKVLFEQGVAKIGQKRLVERLVEWGYLYRDSKKRPHAYQRYIEQGLFVTKARVYTHQETGETRASSAPQVRITGKGLDVLFRRFRYGQIALPGLAA